MFQEIKVLQTTISDRALKTKPERVLAHGNQKENYISILRKGRSKSLFEFQ